MSATAHRDSTAPAPRRSAVDAARAVADAVLYEGYVLYPYRASAVKNSYRWQWGVVVPARRAALVAGRDGAIPTGERAELAFEVPLLATPDTRVSATARFLQLCHRQVHDPDGRPVDRWEVPADPVADRAAEPGAGPTGAPVEDDLLLTWDEGHERELRTPPLPVFALLEVPFVQSVRMDPVTTGETHADGSSTERRLEEVVAEVEMAAEELGDDVVRLRITVRNVTPWADADADRDTVLRRSMVGTHVLASTLGGRFGSVVDPPAWAAEGTWAREGLHPVLAGEGGQDGDEGDDDVVLAAPIILDDHPRIADESPGPAFDALEIDELMALAVQGLTEEEKREARATDPRAAELVDTFGALPPAVMERLHGTVRELRGAPGEVDVRSTAGLRPEPEARVDPETVELLGIGEEPLERVVVGGVTVEVGDVVTLSPRRRADVHDLIADGRHATVERMVRTLDGDTMLAVTLVEDPAAELHRWYGRFQYFHLDEIAVEEHGSHETDSDTGADDG